MQFDPESSIKRSQIMPVDAIGIGDAMVDLATQTPTIPTRGGNVWSSPVKMTPGGTVANVAVNLSKLGLRSAFVGCLGRDPFADFCLDRFRENNVDVTEMEYSQDINTGIVMALIDSTGERTFIACAKGASHTLLSEEHVRKINFERARFMHTSGVCLLEEPASSSILKALKLARERGLKTFFDPNLRLEGDVFPDLLRNATMQALRLSDVVLVGEEEIDLLFGCQLDHQEIIHKLFDMGVETIVVKQSAKGATAYTRQGKITQNAFKVDVMDTTGAGDSFDAGFIAAIIRNASLKDALEYACAVAAIKVTRIGARAVPPHEEIVQFIEKHHVK